LAALDAGRRALVDPERRRVVLWHALWMPFTLWSDAPEPAWPRRGAAIPRELGLAGRAVVSGVDRLRRRLWVTHAAAAVCRGIWLGLALAVLLMLLDVVGGPVFNPMVAGAIGGVILLAALVAAVLSRPSRPGTARMLDRSFGLHERLGTALDDLGQGVPAAGEHAPVVYLQMADAANAIAVLRNDRRLRQSLPVREVLLIVYWALVLATCAFLRGLGGGLPELATARVPVFTPAIERPADPAPSAADVDPATMAPTVQEVMNRSDRSTQARHDLQALAAALSDHAVGRPAAEQIARGDYNAAGDQLRQAADQAGDLAQTSRQELAGDLDQAASQMQPNSTGLHEATDAAASGLQQGGEPASKGLRDLADAVEQAGKQVVPQSELAAQMRSAQQAAAQRGDSGSQASGAPMDSGAGDAASQSGASGAPGSGVQAQTSTSAQSGGQGDRSAQAGNDPGNADGGQRGQSGEGGQAQMPGASQQPGEGQSGQSGQAAQGGETAGGQRAEGDAATSQQGGGAGTGQAGDVNGERAASSGGESQNANGQAPANPEVSKGSGAEGDPSTLIDPSQRVALPVGTGQQGMQTAADGGSALRGSGAGVTAGSGYAVQGDVGEAGPDSNRVPPEHRDTVERYFSEGSDP
jgi:hypothetical protein